MLIASEADLIEAFRTRRHALGLSGEALDDIAGTSDRYTAKLENPDAPWGKRAVRMSFWLWLGALKLVLVAVPVENTRHKGRCPCCGRAQQADLQRGKRGASALLDGAR